MRVQIGSVQAVTQVGKEVAVPVRVQGVCGLGGFRLSVSMDRQIADLVRAEPTEFLRGEPPVDIAFTPPHPGQYIVEAHRPKGAPGVSGFGTIARLVLRGRGVGSTHVSLLHLQLFDTQGEFIESWGVPLRLTVSQAPESRKRRTPAVKSPPS